MHPKPVNHLPPTPAARPRFAAWLVPALALLALLAAGPAAVAENGADQKTREGEEKDSERPEKIADMEGATPIMSLDDVRVGMKGYGLTVFSGTKVEPFPVEVVSVMRDFRPDTSVIWILCDDPRLEESGPVSGMSGSPIYLWTDDDEGELGEGGKLVGAFAYGYMGTKKCYAGVQPIEYMRTVAGRTPEEPKSVRERRRAEQVAAAAAVAGELGHPAASPPQAGSPGQLRNDLTRLVRHSQRQDGRVPTWRAEQLLKMLPESQEQAVAAWADDRELPRGPGGVDGTVQRMQLPLALPSRQAAALLEPLLEPMGMMPVAGGGALGKLPEGFEPGEVELEPGSVISIPYAFGDLDLAASGTVTDVLPDGSVVALGHAMFGHGEVEMPMASGFVHYVVPRYTGSFKLSGSLDLKGVLLRDENPAVVGRPGIDLKTAPLKVTVNLPGERNRSFDYQVVRNPEFMGEIAGILALESVLTEQTLPPEHTVRIRGELHFEGGHTVAVDEMETGISPWAMIMTLAPAVGSMANNPFERVLLERAELTVDVEDEARSAQLTGARLTREKVAPGEKLEVRISLRPHRRPVEFHTFSIDIPENMPEGEYMLSVSDSQAYADRFFSLQPHENLIRSADDLAEGLGKLGQMRNDHLYLLVPAGVGGTAVNREALPDLPGSRAAMLAVPFPDRQVAPFARLVEKRQPMDYVIRGSRELRFEVDRDAQWR